MAHVPQGDLVVARPFLTEANDDMIDKWTRVSWLRYQVGRERAPGRPAGAAGSTRRGWCRWRVCDSEVRRHGVGTQLVGRRDGDKKTPLVGTPGAKPAPTDARLILGRA